MKNGSMNRLHRFFLHLFIFLYVPFLSAQTCSLVCNTDFENNQLAPPGHVAILNQSNMDCWKTTATDQMIEIWGSGFNGVPAYSGNEFIELNATQVATLYQDFTSAPGATVSISFAHRGRAGTDVMSVSIGPLGGPFTTLGIFSADETAWIYSTVNYTFPATPGTYSLQFNSISAAGGNPGIGNFLDAISVALPSPTLTLTTVNPTCTDNGSATVTVLGGGSPYVYTWTPAAPNTNALANLPAGQYTVTVTDDHGCTVDTTFQLTQMNTGTGAATTPDTLVCPGSSAPLNATGGGTYLWSPAASLSDPAISSPVATPSQTTLYSVEITTPSGCVIHDEVLVEVNAASVNPGMPDTITLCNGTSKVIQVSGADSYTWLPATGIAPLTGPTVTVSPTTSGTYYCDFTGACATIRDSVFVAVVSAIITAGPDTVVCPNQSVPLHAAGGVAYAWSPPTGLDHATGSDVLATVTHTTVYEVTGTDANGCIATASASVTLASNPFIQVSPDVFASIGDAIQLTAVASMPGQITWSPAEFLSCVVCTSPIAQPDKQTTYTASYTDASGCTATASVTISYDATLYIPNAFTPDGNEFNNLFRAVGGNIETFELTIYNRWGEEICRLRSLSDTWDGTYKDQPCPDGTYTWKVRYTDLEERVGSLEGHVVLLR